MIALFLSVVQLFANPLKPYQGEYILYDWDGNFAVGKLEILAQPTNTGIRISSFSKTQFPVQDLLLSHAFNAEEWSQEGDHWQQTWNAGEKRMILTYKMSKQIGIELTECVQSVCTQHIGGAFRDTPPGDKVELSEFTKGLKKKYPIESVSGEPPSEELKVAQVAVNTSEIAFLLPYCKKGAGCDPGERSFPLGKVKISQLTFNENKVRLIYGGPKNLLYWMERPNQIVAINPFYAFAKVGFSLEHTLNPAGVKEPARAVTSAGR